MSQIEQNKIFKVLKLIQKLYTYPPKSITQLADQLEISDKSIYRYLNLLEELGYEVQKNEQKKWFIKQGNKSNHLDEDEKKLIVSLLNSTSYAKTKTQSIKSKLQIDNTLPTAQELSELRYLKIIDLINYAISERIPLQIVGYQGMSGTVDVTRLVIPQYFDDNRLVLIAYDFEKQDIRHFKIQRMEDLHLAEKQAFMLEEIQIPGIDLFGMSSTQSYSIEMLLSKRAYLLLIEEFPQSLYKIAPYPDHVTFPYIFKDQVCSYEGVGRFVLGLINEIQVINDQGFKEYLQNKIKNSTLLTN